jgi:elongation factor G
MGELHLKVFEERLAAELRGRVHLSAPRVLTRQTVAMPAVARAECRRHLDGEEVSAAVELRVEPRPGLGPARVGTIVKGPPKPVRHMLRRLLLDQLRAGLSGPAPAHDLEVSVLAASGVLEGVRGEAVCGEALAIACRKLALGGRLVTLEPYVDCEVCCPTESLSGALSDLRARGADLSEVATVDGAARIHSVLPLARVLGYATRLRSLTRGLGTVHLRPVGMRPEGGA